MNLVVDSCLTVDTSFTPRFAHCRALLADMASLESTLGEVKRFTVAVDVGTWELEER